jgi:hypothetical protein
LEDGNTSKPVTLNAFQRYNITIEYVSKGQVTPVSFAWQGPGFAKMTVPKEVLFSTPIADKTSLIASNGVPEKIIQLNISTGKSVRGLYPWKISDFASDLPLGTVIQWRLEARDNNDVSGPGVAFSDPLRQLRLVSPTDKRKELMDTMTDTLQQIDKLKDDQTQNQNRAGSLVTGTPVDGAIDLPDQKPQK